MNMLSRNNCYSSQSETHLSLGNIALRKGKTTEAIQHYIEALFDTPELSESITINLRIAKKKYSTNRKNIAHQKIAFFWSLPKSHKKNNFLTESIQDLSDIEIVEILCPAQEASLLPEHKPLKKTLQIKNIHSFFDQAIFFTANNPYDLIYLSQASIPDFIFGILYKRIWGAQVLQIADTEPSKNIEDPHISSIPLHTSSALQKDWPHISAKLMATFDGVIPPTLPPSIQTNTLSNNPINSEAEEFIQRLNHRNLSLLFLNTTSILPLSNLTAIPQDHYQQVEIIKKSGLYHEEWYLWKNPDLNKDNALLHYCVFGYKEGRNINPFFDSLWYMRQYLENQDTNPLIHYITIGWRTGCNPSIKFDTQLYIKQYPEVKTEPLSHFLSEGKNKGCKAFRATPLAKTGSSQTTISEKLIPEISKIIHHTKKTLSPKARHFNSNQLDIHFVIPDFGVGGGGHMTIFRMVRWLEYFGHKIKIWIFAPTVHTNANSAYDDIIKNYQTIKAEVSFIDSNFPNSAGDIIIATAWDTVWPVLSAQHFKRRFYMVQDYEPSFFAKGAKSELAESTYQEDLDCICASPWLKCLMEKKFNRWATSFDLAFDTEIFYPAQTFKVNSLPRIAFYARIFTERRGVELGLLALDLLAKSGVKFHVDFFGAELNLDSAPFSYTEHGVKPPSYLGELYRAADIGVVFSLTNYSLVPQEMMACGLPIVEFDGENTRAIYPENTVVFAGPAPTDIAKKISALLSNKELQRSQANKALQWVREFSWEKSARDIEFSIISRLVEIGYIDKKPVEHRKKIHASIVVPVLNGGPQLHELIFILENQKTPWPYEIIILDSESTDGTAEYLKTKKEIITHTIKRTDFNHGATRNFGASIARGEFIAFLTQDAIPTDEHWLYNLVSILEHFPNAAGAFGRHIPHDNASFYTCLELNNHFNNLLNYPLSVSKYTDLEKYESSTAWRQMLHFYSDNNSCMRKSVFNILPYRNVKYGEDQLWAHDIIQAGYEKVYAASAVVKHSHDYNEQETYARSEIEADYFNYFWNYKMIDSANLEKIINDFQKHDKIIGFENALPDNEINKRCSLIRARFEGYAAGQATSLSLFDDRNTKRSKF